MIFGKLVPIVLLSVGVVSASLITTPPPTITAEEMAAIDAAAPKPHPPAPPAPPKTTLPSEKPGEKWEPLARSSTISIDLDTASMKVSSRNGGFDVSSRFRITFFQEIEVVGKKKKGWYYVNVMSARCKDDTISIDESIVYSKDHVELARGKNLGILSNPKDGQSFVTVWLAISCVDLRNKQAPTFI